MSQFLPLFLAASEFSDMEPWVESWLCIDDKVHWFSKQQWLQKAAQAPVEARME